MTGPIAKQDVKSETLHPVRVFASGLCMGAADIVPGVSGGTVALVLGVYQRLLTAISHFDSRFLWLIRNKQWAAAIAHIDLRFLLVLGAGVLTGALGLAGVMDFLLHEHRSLTFAAFFGLILASGVLVGRMTQAKGAGQVIGCVALGVVAAGIAFWLTNLGHVAPMPGLVYTFLCGAIAICAMILPGVSGAYLLLVLGKYEHVTGILKSLPRGQATGDDLVTIAVFCAGCLTGLLLFSKLLKWLLEAYWTPTMSVLCGFMMGSLYRVWPLQIDTTPEIEKIKHKVFQPYWPEQWTSEATWCLLIAVGCFVGVLLIDSLANRVGESSDPAEPEQA